MDTDKLALTPESEKPALCKNKFYTYTLFFIQVLSGVIFCLKAK